MAVTCLKARKQHRTRIKCTDEATEWDSQRICMRKNELIFIGETIYLSL